MFETRRNPRRILLTCLMIAAMVASSLPFGLALAAPGGGEGGAQSRTVVDNANDLIVPAGESYTLSGSHRYSRSVQINGTLTVAPYAGDEKTGILNISSKSIFIGEFGSIHGEGRGYGGGGGGTSFYSSGQAGGKAGVGGNGGNGANAVSGYAAGGGGGGSNGGAGGTSPSGYGVGAPGTEISGGNGGTYSSYQGGMGGAGFGGGGGGGHAASAYGGGGGGGGGSGGKDATNQVGGDGGGPFFGKGGTSTTYYYAANEDGKNGGYKASGGNGDTSTDLIVTMGSGGGGGAAANYYTGGAGGGGAGGGAVMLFSDGDLIISGSIYTCGASGGKGGYYSSSDSYKGGPGGGGGGGGVLLSGLKVIIGGTVDARGKNMDTPTITNGGTIKLLYSDLFSGGSLTAGRVWQNGRPRMKGLIEPLSGSMAVVKPTFKWNPAFDPDSDVVSYEIQISSSPTFAGVAWSSKNIQTEEYAPPVPLKGKEFYWHVRAYDSLGPGAWSEGWKILVDASPPVSEMASLPEYVTNATFPLSWTGSDNIEVANYTVYYSDMGGAYKAWGNDTPNLTCMFTGIEGHTYRFYTLASDASGNVETVPMVPDATTTIDSVAPTASMLGLAAYQAKPIFQVSWTGKDLTSGIAGFTIYFSQDRGPFRVWQDNVGETSAVFKGDESHEYAFYVIATDVAGNAQAAPTPEKIQRTKVDTKAPATSFSPSKPFFGDNPVYVEPSGLITLAGADNYAGIGQTFYIIDSREMKEYTGPFKETFPGPHNITYWSIDNAMNEEKRHTTFFSIDGDAPTTTLTFDGPSVNKEGTDTIFVSASTVISMTPLDPGSGVDRTVMMLDGVPMQYIGPMKLTKGGSHILKYYSVDNLGQQEPETNTSLVTDIWAPNTVPSGPTGYQRNSVTIELLGVDLESGYQGSFYRIVKQGEPPLNFVNGSEVVLEAKDDHSMDGVYRVDFYSVDQVGNREPTRSVQVIIDTTPVLAVSSKSQTVDNSRFVLKGTTEPGATLLVNGKQVLVKPDGSFAYTMELGKGKNKIVVAMNDAAGNTANEQRTITYTPKASLPGWVMPAVIVIILAVVAAIGMVLFNRSRNRRMAERSI